VPADDKEKKKGGGFDSYGFRLIVKPDGKDYAVKVLLKKR